MRRPKAKLSPAQHEEIVRRHRAGEGSQALAESFGLTRQGVHLIVKRHTLADGVVTGPQALSATQWAWLTDRLSEGPRDDGDKWSQALVRRLVKEKFGVTLNLKSHRSGLRELGVRIGPEHADEELPLPADFYEYVNSPLAQQIRDRQEALLRQEKPRPVPQRGRPRKTRVPPAEAEAVDEGFEGPSLEAMRASVAATMATLPVPATLPSHGVRTGKHAKGQKPTLRRKKKRRG